MESNPSLLRALRVRMPLPTYGPALTGPFPVPVYLDGMKSREELLRQVLEDVQNRLLNRS